MFSFIIFNSLVVHDFLESSYSIRCPVAGGVDAQCLLVVGICLCELAFLLLDLGDVEDAINIFWVMQQGLLVLSDG